MNSSQNRTLAIGNHCRKVNLVDRIKGIVVSLFFLINLQGCSTIESIFDGSIFSEAPPQAIEDKGELDEEKPEIKDLKSASKSEIKPITPRPTATSQAKVNTPPLKSIEIMWQVPTEAVEAYHIYLLSGATEQVDESKHFRVLVTNLKKEDDPTYGPVYKYLVPGNVTANTIQIRAENRFGLSEPSEPMVVQR